MKCYIEVDVDAKALFDEELIGEGFGVKHYLEYHLGFLYPKKIQVLKIESLETKLKKEKE